MEAFETAAIFGRTVALRRRALNVTPEELALLAGVSVRFLSTLALPLAGKRSRLSRRTLLEFGTRIGVREKAATDILDRLLEATADLDAALSDAAIPFDSASLPKTRRELTFRRRQLSST